jgi:hypothetical protein
LAVAHGQVDGSALEMPRDPMRRHQHALSGSTHLPLQKVVVDRSVIGVIQESQEFLIRIRRVRYRRLHREHHDNGVTTDEHAGRLLKINVQP